MILCVNIMDVEIRYVALQLVWQVVILMAHVFMQINLVRGLDVLQKYHVYHHQAAIVSSLTHMYALLESIPMQPIGSNARLVQLEHIVLLMVQAHAVSAVVGLMLPAHHQQQ